MNPVVLRIWSEVRNLVSKRTDINQTQVQLAFEDIGMYVSIKNTLRNLTK